MAKIVIVIPAQSYSVSLDGWEEDYLDEDTGQWDMDGLYDGFIHEIVTQPNYDMEITE